jgi:hypothetical protein
VPRSFAVDVAELGVQDGVQLHRQDGVARHAAGRVQKGPWFALLYS